MTRRALVLGGGGITGIAWEWGILAGLARAGLHLTDADVVIGTSAGSVVGAQVANGLDPEDRYTAQLAPPDGELGAAFPPGLMFRLALAAVGPRAGLRRRIGQLALRAKTVPEQERIDVIESRLPVTTWPAERDLKITAVAAESGEFTVFDRDSGVPLVHAVAASCAVPGVWPPVTVGERRYVDGGVRSPANADLAADCDRVVVLAPLVAGLGAGTSVAAQTTRLRETATVTVVSPTKQAKAAFGRNVLDPTKRAAAARAGLTQSADVVSQVRAVWES